MFCLAFDVVPTASYCACAADTQSARMRSILMLINNIFWPNHWVEEPLRIRGGNFNPCELAHGDLNFVPQCSIKTLDCHLFSGTQPGPVYNGTHCRLASPQTKANKENYCDAARVFPAVLCVDCGVLQCLVGRHPDNDHL